MSIPLPTYNSGAFLIQGTGPTWTFWDAMSPEPLASLAQTEGRAGYVLTVETLAGPIVVPLAESDWDKVIPLVQAFLNGYALAMLAITTEINSYSKD